jgi:hypothetical protein
MIQLSPDSLFRCEGWNAREPLSLWQMINFKLGSTILFIKSLEKESFRFKSYCVEGLASDHLDDSNIDLLTKATTSAYACFDKLGDAHVMDAIKDLEKIVINNGSNIDVFAKLNQLSQSIHIALGNRLYYAYPIDKAKLFRGWRADWEPVYSYLAYPVNPYSH